MNTLVIKHASTFHGINTRGYILAIQSQDTHMSSLFGEVMPVYESVQSWPIYSTKSQAKHVIMLILMLASILPENAH